MQTEDWIEIEHDFYLQTAKRLPIVLERGEGTVVWDSEGKQYLDFVGGIAVTSLGHANPVIVEALTRQAQKLITVSNLYYTVPQLKLAKLLCESSGMDKAFFCNSGAEAVEGLIKLARKWGKEKRDGAYEIIVADDAFHGRTLATVSASANERYRAPFTPLPEGFPRVPYNDVEAIKAATTGKTVAVLLEPLQGEGGVNVPDDDYLPAVRSWCDEAGILLLLDEVQTGAGRTGKLFCFQHYGIEPDALALAKALAGGVPIGAFLMKDSAALLGPGEHGTTFGGNALACEVGYSVLKYMIDNDLPAQVAKRGEHLERRLISLADRQPMITEVRGKGLIWAIELDRPVSEAVVTRCLEAGLLINGVKPTALRFLPPFTVSEKELDTAVAIVERVLGEISEEK
ncbi:MAG: aspartate aminotransferase family protein [Chloroflexi bacterium]|nr:aspartate aminotransferase family protein [Chloroflexota bacterium]MCI0831844.1 aspartate aminotransferase family protein [Chloroflexota bacterium]MCI0839047.1 aspartate aminotransferase family protein [Chloroflexota bacterium]MCI0843153.1 aspartate aminotransferase family protein [Chloroflexota bacterium]MCI0883684.1 aspartate aminotransferase family protein [Chloroflexota bacterium]